MQQVLLVTDYNMFDANIGLMKSVIEYKSPNIKTIDLAHGVPYDDIGLAAQLIYKHLKFGFTGNIYLASVNNLYQRSPRYIAFHYKENYFIGPDNGLFSLVFNNLNTIPVFNINYPDNEPINLYAIYSHAIACIHHNLGLDTLGQVVEKIDMKLLFLPVVTSDTIRATITSVDSFGNVITNLDKKTFYKSKGERSFKIFYDPRNPVTIINEHHGQVAIGEVSCIFNKSDHLELGVNHGSIADLYNLRKNETIQIDFI
jgi:S-adenosylmethionine hydrolase